MAQCTSLTHLLSCIMRTATKFVQEEPKEHDEKHKVYLPVPGLQMTECATWDVPEKFRSVEGFWP